MQSAEDLRGKVFAIPHKQSTHKLLLDELLTRSGMTEGDLTVVEMTPPEMPAALAQGQIAGYCVAEPFGTQALLLGTGHILARSDELWEDSPCCALVFHGDFAEEHTELARAAVRAYLDASEHLTEHPEEQTKIAGHFLKTQPDVLAATFDYISYESPILSRAVYDDLTYRMRAEGLIARIPSYEEFVDERLLP